MEYIRAELKPQRITGSASTVVSVGRSFLGNIRLNASSGAISIFDAASVATMGVAASAVAVIASGTLILSHDFGYVIANGLIVSTSAAGSDFTVASANN